MEGRAGNLGGGSINVRHEIKSFLLKPICILSFIVMLRKIYKISYLFIIINT